MEKKVPERKVTLKDDDIIYVYDKRIVTIQHPV